MKAAKVAVILLLVLVGAGLALYIRFFTPSPDEFAVNDSVPVATPIVSPGTSPVPIASPSPAATPTASPTNEIILTRPQPMERITSPLAITGQARGSWYFEATFPVVLTDWDGLIIAEGYATAQSDWMTEAYVPFTATLTFTKPGYGERGSLILQKANPSGLPQHDDALEITILFQ
jgi:hypothetical protein